MYRTLLLLLSFTTACVPVIRTEGAPELPEQWQLHQYFPVDDALLVIPVWSTLSGIASDASPIETVYFAESPFMIDVVSMPDLPERIGGKLSSFMVTSNAAAGRRAEFEGVYLFSSSGVAMLMVSAHVTRVGPRWRAVLVSKMSHAWHEAIELALEQGAVRLDGIGENSIWSAQYTVLPPAGASPGAIEEYVKGIKFPHDDMRFKFPRRDRALIEWFLGKIPDGRLSISPLPWQQVIRN